MITGSRFQTMALHPSIRGGLFFFRTVILMQTIAGFPRWKMRTRTHDFLRKIRKSKRRRGFERNRDMTPPALSLLPLPHVQFWETDNGGRLARSHRGSHRRDIP